MPDQQASTLVSHRIALGVEYQGARYYGWQIQKSEQDTVQYYVEAALSSVADHPVRCVSAGRTDAGVHAVGQVIHFESDAKRDLVAWLKGANANLPKDIRIRWSHHVDADFHARFSATSRRYMYIIDNRPVSSAIQAPLVTHQIRPLDAKLMHDVAQEFVGEHDFTSFRSSKCQAKSPRRTITHINVERVNESVVIDIRANAFLHHMVRNIAGVLMPIGYGKAPESWAKQVLDARDRAHGGKTASPKGLYLVQVDYPARFNIPASPKIVTLTL